MRFALMALVACMVVVAGDKLFVGTNAAPTLATIGYGTTNTPCTFDTTHTGGAPANFYDVEWRDNGNLLCHMTLKTNITTEWTTVREVWCTTPAQLMVYCTDAIYQVGSLVTNRVLTVTNGVMATNVVLQELGRNMWPSQQRVQRVPASHRPY